MPTRTQVAAAAVLIAVLAAGCGDAPRADDPRDAQIAQLTRAVEGLTASNEELGREVRRQGRQLAGLSRVRAAPGDASAATASAPDDEPLTAARDRAAVGPAVDPVADPETASEAPDDSVAAAAVAALLESEAGRKAIQDATVQEAQRREQSDRRLYVSYQVGVFAREAGLDDRKTEQLQSIWKTSMDAGVELRREFAAIAALPEADREGARARAMESMRDIGRERLGSVRAILSGEQLEKYEKADEVIVGGLHGAPRR